MNAESGGFFTSTTLFKTSLLTVALSAIYVYEPSRKHFIPAPASPPQEKKSVTAKPKAEKTIQVKKKKTIYLTFDDGPNAGTKKVMDILQQEDIPATLFLIGEHVYGSKMQKDIYDSLLLSRHIELANHSFTHACHNSYEAFYNNADTVTKDFQRCADSLHFSNSIVRTPGRNIWRTENVNVTDIKKSKEAGDSIRSKGFIALGWDVEWHFTKTQHLVQSDSLMINEIDSAFAKNLTKNKNALVLLAHDRSFLSPEDSGALHNLIKKLKQKGDYAFETVSSYPGTN